MGEAFDELAGFLDAEELDLWLRSEVVPVAVDLRCRGVRVFETAVSLRCSCARWTKLDNPSDEPLKRGYDGRGGVGTLCLRRVVLLASRTDHVLRRGLGSGV